MARPLVQYNLDLLTSFDARSGNGGLMAPEEGFRRLQQLIRDRALTSVVRVKLHVEPASVVIADAATGKEMEHIPAGLIYQPITANPNEFKPPYDNILVFTVLEDSFQMAPPEMYFFQCLYCSAQEVVNTLKAATGSQLQHRRTSSNGTSATKSNNEAQRTASSNTAAEPTGKTTQNIKLLDRCLDDIEKFVQRLQLAAEAHSKLDQRRNERQGGADVVGQGDGMLRMRARPPPPADFISVLQKFKFCINLLSVLKGHIHNPNAPEMIHFLFKPLAMVVDSVRDADTGSPLIVQTVVSPLLTAESIQLLSDCLTTRESQLWRSLGDPWTCSRDQWREKVPLYIPVFADGWSPPLNWIEDNVSYGQNEPNEQLYRTKSQVNDNAVSRVDQSMTPPVANSRLPDAQTRDVRQPPAIFPLSDITGVVDEKQQKFAWELLAKGAKIFLLTDSYTAANPKELSVRKGEVVEVLDDSRNWWSVRNSLGATGFVPFTLLQPYISPEKAPVEQRRASYGNNQNRSSTTAATPPPIARQDAIPVAMRSGPEKRSSQYASDPPITNQRLSVNGDIRSPVENPPIAVAQSTKNGKDQRQSYAERPIMLAAPAFGYQDPPVSQRTAVEEQHHEPTYEETLDVNGSPIARPRTAVDDLNDEFRKKILSGPEVAAKPKPKVQQQVYITQDSTNEDIFHWLQFKGFSYGTQQQLSPYDGKALFGLSKAKLEMMCGSEEGSRVYSQILVQRNLSGFKTTRSSELQAILRNRKMKSDEPANGGAELY